jgi:hypothetical protein
MTNDDFIMQVDRALGMLGAAFESMGMKCPTAVLLGSVDDIEILRTIRPSHTVARGVDGNLPESTICRIHGVAFRRDFYHTN